MGSLSIWHWLVVFVVFGLPVVIFVWLNRSANITAGGGPSGFRGWLLLMAIGIWLGPLYTIGQFDKTTKNVDPALVAKYHLVFEGETALFAVLVIMQVAAIVLMMRRSWRFVPFFLCMNGFAIMLPIIDVLWSSVIVSSISGQSMAYLLNLLAEDAGVNVMVMVIATVPWMLYVTRSRRVANTFVRGMSAPVVTG